MPEYAEEVQPVRELISGEDDRLLLRLRDELSRLAGEHRFEDATSRRDRLVTLIPTLDRGQRFAALAGIPELVAARPDGHRGWELAVIRYGRLASAGVARRGVAPLPVVDALRQSAETVLPGDGPLRGAAADEVRVILGWLQQPGTRLVHTERPWCEPVRAAGRWRSWVTHAEAGRAGYAGTN